MAKVLKAQSVEAAKPGETRREVPDAGLPGLYLVVQPTGAKSWAFRYRIANKPKKLTLGRFPALSLAEAREEARKAARAVEMGQDPNLTKATAKADAREAQETDRDKVKTLIEQFDKRHLSQLKSGAHALQFLRRFVVKAWGERDIRTISKRDVIELLDGIVDAGTPTTANRVLAHVRKFFNWCVERDIIERAPTDGVKAPAQERSRDRVLVDDEIRWLWRASAKLEQPFDQLVRVLLLTGQRLGEVAGMTDAELDGDLWRLAGTRTKNARAHAVPLSEPAIEALASVRRIKGAQKLIFTTTGTTPVSGWDRAAKRIRESMATAATKERGEPVEIPHWTFHDLRRTAATGMARLGFPVQVTEAVLNHASGTVSGIVAVYQRHDYAAEKRAALDAWARHVLAIVGEGAADNVVVLAR